MSSAAGVNLMLREMAGTRGQNPGDSSDACKLSKSGWLFKSSRWRVQRRYFHWDVDEHRLALYNTNKDERPAKLYTLGAATVINAVEDAAAAGASSGTAKTELTLISHST